MENLKDLQVTQSEVLNLLHTTSPYHYVKSLNYKSPYDWQAAILKSRHKRKVINGARQAGKSTIISAKPCHIAKHYPESVSIIIAATEYQAFLDMEKVKEFIAHDPTFPELKRESDRLIVLDNKSWIMVVPATEKSARGPSAPRLILLDEASRIEDIVYTSGVIPMLTDNPDAELISISTPNGKSGFFFKSFKNPKWERYEIRSPWKVIESDLRLEPAEPEDEYKAKCAKKGIIGFNSPRHMDRAEQQFNLEEMGTLMYKQEYGPLFVEPKDQVFDYEDIERLMNSNIAPFEPDKIGIAEPLIL